MELKEYLAITSTLAGVVISMLTIYEKVSKKAMQALGIWLLVNLGFAVMGSLMYFGFTSSWNSNPSTVTRILFGLIPLLSLYPAILWVKDDLDSASFGQFIILSIIGTAIISYFIYWYLFYIAIALFAIYILFFIIIMVYGLFKA